VFVKDQSFLFDGLTLGTYGLLRRVDFAMNFRGSDANTAPFKQRGQSLPPATDSELPLRAPSRPKSAKHHHEILLNYRTSDYAYEKLDFIADLKAKFQKAAVQEEIEPDDTLQEN